MFVQLLADLADERKISQAGVDQYRTIAAALETLEGSHTELRGAWEKLREAVREASVMGLEAAEAKLRGEAHSEDSVETELSHSMHQV
jgi:hypothetical protein